MSDKDNDAAVLISEREITINGEDVVIHEYSFRETLKFHRQIDLLVNKLTDLLMEKKEISTGQIKSLIADYADIVAELVAGSVNKPVAWVDGLKGQAAIDLFEWWWVVQSPFFIAAVKRQEMYRDVQRARAAEKKNTPPAQD
ncbi:DUF6631 family protein [Klebsiella indica]|uniref:DUF6631 family protein n=1 Tax=Klebsiella TaxID=570 RepID=UPI00374FFF6C